jgi:hypothetical protein
MPAAVAATPVSGSITAKTTVVRFNVTDTDDNDLTAYNNQVYPTSPQLTYYLKFTVGGVEEGRSYVFNVGSDGKHEFNNYIFPSAGSWTVDLCNASTDAQVATLALTVS